MFQVVEKLRLVRDFEELKRTMIDIYKKNRNIEFYGVALHMNYDDDEERMVKGRIILTMNTSFILHDNPWEEDGDDYHANFSRRRENQNMWFVPKEYVDGHEDEEFLWVKYEEIRDIEMRYTPTSNKEAAGALERYDRG